MKTAFYTALFIGLSCFAIGQETTKTMMVDGIEREYIEYIPGSYDQENSSPIVFFLHGLGGTMDEYSHLGLQEISEEHAWIVMSPQALPFDDSGIPIPVDLGAVWNAGIGIKNIPFLGDIILNENVDDAGFMMSILDAATVNLNINTDSVFFIGYSAGGFMCNKLAIEYPHRITAIASVSGTIGEFITQTPNSAVDVLQIHGTEDTVVSYTNPTLDLSSVGFGSFSIGMGVDECIAFWNEHNETTSEAIITDYPDSQNDGLTAEKFLYTNADSTVRTAHIKVTGGEHQWYMSPQNDIDYTKEIYNFFTTSLIPVETNIETRNILENVSVYPNPASDYLTISMSENEANLRIYNQLGIEVMNMNLSNSDNMVDISRLSEGLYIFKIISKDSSIDKKVIITR